MRSATCPHVSTFIGFDHGRQCGCQECASSPTPAAARKRTPSAAARLQAGAAARALEGIEGERVGSGWRQPVAR
eukprot:scaffold91910_cov36-Phaeocystis_antarctica.AAC.1